MRVEEGSGAGLAAFWPGGGGTSGTSGTSGTAVPASAPEVTSPYWTFYEAVAAAQLEDWVSRERCRVLDLSGRHSRFAEQLGRLGHDVLHVNDSQADADRTGSGAVTTLRADARSLTWLRDASVDAVLAESRALSLCLAAEVTAEELLRVLRPGGRLLLVVESLLLGLARLADQGRWAELADVPAADVVLVPDEDGSITRCFWPEELRGLLEAVGFEVDWVRPRSVLAPAAVERALEQGGDAALDALVRTELALAREREGESTGMHLVASARRPL